MISAAAMVGCGKAYQNLMVDVEPGNSKLVVRARHIVMATTGCDGETATLALEQAGGHVKTVIIMILSGCCAEEARQRLTGPRTGSVKPSNKRTTGTQTSACCFSLSKNPSFR